MAMFAGFVDADFEAYAPQKWKSNLFNRERLDVKQKLLQFARELGAHLAAADGSPLEIEASVEHPALWNHKQVEAQHVFFSRNQAARRELDAIIDRSKSMASLIDDPTPQRNHLFLMVSISRDDIELGVKLHPDARIDRQNLERKLADHFACERLLGLVARLPDGFQVGLTGSAGLAGSSLDEAGLLGTVAQLAGAGPSPPFKADGPHGPSLWFVSRRVARGEVILAGAEFLAAARVAFAGLLPIYHFIAWSRDNDFVSMRDVLQREKEAKRQHGLAKLDEVRIVRGIFAGKSGIVQDVDGKGSLKVLIGKMVVKTVADDVVKR